MTSIPAAVLDTNVVLDWLVFRNPGCTPLARAIQTGQLRWLVTESMRDELHHVLDRGLVDRWRPDRSLIWESWRLHSSEVPNSDVFEYALRLRCTDADDQQFVDLAASRAQWLFSRDRAVLKLRRRALQLGLRIATPEQWPA